MEGLKETMQPQQCTEKKSRNTRKQTGTIQPVPLKYPKAIIIDGRLISSNSAYSTLEGAAATNANTAIQIMSSSVRPSTAQGYAGKMNNMERYFRSNNWELTIPLELVHVVSFFGSLENAGETYKANNTMGGYMSAIRWWYKEHGRNALEPDLEHALSRFRAGYKRRTADRKMNGEMAVFEGKYHLTYSGYKMLAKKFFKHKNAKQMLNAWPHLLLQWNMIARSESVAAIMVNHINWDNDCMILTIPREKTKQDGDRTVRRHIYANPHEPMLCPILATAVLVFSHSMFHNPVEEKKEEQSEEIIPEIQSNTRKRKNSKQPKQQRKKKRVTGYALFDGPCPEAVFSNILHRELDNMTTEELAVLGGETPEDIGTHSIRKGAASFCCGMVGGPNAVQVYLRAGWSLGKVQDCYLFDCEGGDQLCGRAVSGLEMTGINFATLPHHFQDEYKVCWSEVFSSNMYEKMPTGFQKALPYLLATLIGHEKFLRENLPKNHPLFNSLVFTSGMNETILKQTKIITGIGKCKQTGMQATGVPPHLMISERVDALIDSMLSQFKTMPVSVVDLIRSRVRVQGMHAVTPDDIHRAIAEMMQRIDSRFNDLNIGMRSKINAASNENPSSENNYKFKLHVWKNGQMSKVPEDFKTPTDNLKNIWFCWYFGNAALGVGPYRQLENRDLPTKNDKEMMSKIKGVFDAILNTVNADENIVKKMTREESAAFFDNGIKALIGKLQPNRPQEYLQWNNMSVSTVYNKLAKHKKAVVEEALVPLPTTL